jgi:hypothetical protein
MTANQRRRTDASGRSPAKSSAVQTAGSGRRRLPDWLTLTLILVAALLLLTVFYVGVALNVPYDADQASMVVMGRDVLNGNLLLKGWTLGNQAYYTTDLPFYAVAVALLGFTWRVLYALTGLHWAMLALLVIVLSVPPLLRGLSAASVFIAFSLTLFLPALLLNTLYLSAHLVGFFYCLVCVLIIRYLEPGGSWLQYLLFAVFLALAVIGDAFNLFMLAIPVILVCAFRFLVAGWGRREGILIGLTVAVVILSKVVLAVIAMLGGARIPGPPTAFVALAGLENNAYLFLQSLLELFAVRLFGQPVASLASLIGLIHLSALMLFGAAFYHYARRFLSESLYVQLPVTILALNVVENLFSNAVRPGTTRYLTPLLLFGIPLVTRFVFESRLFEHRRNLVLAYFAILALSLIPPLSFSKPVSQSDALAKILLRLQLSNGYGPYWRSNTATLATAGQVTVRPVLLEGGEAIVPCPCFSRADWYQSYANFLVVQTDDTSGLQPDVAQAIRTFGPPSGRFSLGRDGYLLVWDHDITPYLTIP